VDMFPIYAKAAGFDASKVKWIVAGSDALPGLLASNRVPCVGQFTVGEPLLRMQAAPAMLVRFAFADAGVNFYGNGIIATDTTIATRPDLVRRFVAATIRGMKDAFAHPEEAGRIMNKYHPTIEVAVAKGETEAVAELAQVKGQELGMIEPARIEETINAVTSVFKLKTPVSVNDVYAPGFVAK
jgi:NitT/TauT family transport system substrate-binding protein